MALVVLGVNEIRAIPEQLAPICRLAESEYVGVGCGVTDQLSVFAGRERHAMMLGCRSLQVSFVSIPERLAIVVCDTGADGAASGDVN